MPQTCVQGGIEGRPCVEERPGGTSCQCLLRADALVALRQMKRVLVDCSALWTLVPPAFASRQRCLSVLASCVCMHCARPSVGRCFDFTSCVRLALRVSDRRDRFRMRRHPFPRPREARLTEFACPAQSQGGQQKVCECRKDDQRVHRHELQAVRHKRHVVVDGACQSATAVCLSNPQPQGQPASGEHGCSSGSVLLPSFMRRIMSLRSSTSSGVTGVPSAVLPITLRPSRYAIGSSRCGTCRAATMT